MRASFRLGLAAPDEQLNELLPRLTDCADGRALVVTDNRLVGIVSPTDISRAVQRTALRAPPTPGDGPGEAGGRGRVQEWGQVSRYSWMVEAAGAGQRNCS
ncbi:hypothetical protein GCM10027614_30280 [Micromonospora vulcania]